MFISTSHNLLFVEITKDFLCVMEKADPKLKKHIAASLRVSPIFALKAFETWINSQTNSHTVGLEVDFGFRF